MLGGNRTSAKACTGNLAFQAENSGPARVEQTPEQSPVNSETRQKLVVSREPRQTPKILQAQTINFKLFGNEVYCTNALLSLIKIMLCSTLPYQKVFRFEFFSYKISLGNLWKEDISGC